MKKTGLLVPVRWLVVTVLLFSSLMAFARLAGDIDNDDQLTAKDILLLQKFLLGTDTPTGEEALVADVGPLGAPDEQLTVADLLILQRAVLGSVTLPELPDAPTLNTIPSTTTSNPLPITGTADANSEVRLYVNGELQSTTTAAGDGSFTINAILDDGASDIYVTQWDGAYESLAGASQIVEYQNTLNRTLVGPITADTVLTAGATPTPYVVNSNLVVTQNATLTLMPGVEIQFSGTSTRLQIDGGLDIRGESGNEVVLGSVSGTGTNQWNGIYISAGTGAVTIDHAVIAQAMRGLWFYNSGSRGTVTNALLHQNGTGIYVYGNATPSISSSWIVNNTSYGIHLVGINSATAVSPQPVITGNSIYGNGNGTANRDINTEQYYVSNAIVINATNNWWGIADLAAIEDKIFHAHDAATRPYVDYRAYQLHEGGATADTSAVLMGPQSNSQQLLTAGTTYTVATKLTVPAGETLTVPSGATLQFVEGSRRDLIVPADASLVLEAGATLLLGHVDSELQVSGSLVINGALGNEVMIGSVSGTGVNQWDGIYISAGTGQVTIDHAVIANAERGIEFYNSGSRGTVTNTLLHQNGTGIYMYGNATPVINSSRIINNISNGIHLYGQNSATGVSPQPVITGNSIYGNGNGTANRDINTEQYYVSNTIVINATNNWWGVADLAAIETKVYHANDAATRPYVDYRSYQLYEGGPSADTSVVLIGPQSDSQQPLTADTTYTLATKLVVPTGETLTVPANTALQFVEGADRDLVVESGATLLLEAGSSILFGYSTSQLTVNGSLNVQGTLGNEVVFSSMTQQGAGDWDGIYVNAGDGSTVTINYAVIENATYGFRFASSGSRGMVTHTLIHQNAYGIYANGNANPSISSSRIVNNTTYGIFLQGQNYVNGNSPLPVITGNSIYDNNPGAANRDFFTTTYYQASTVALNATNNWWGTTDLTAIEAKIYHGHDTPASPYVDYHSYQSFEGGPSTDTSQVLIGVQSDSRQVLTAGATYAVATKLTVLSGETLTIPPNTTLQFVEGTKRDLVIENGATLILEAGSQVLFGEGTSQLTVNGSLDIRGVPGNEVVLSSMAQQGAGDWDGIYVNAGDGSTVTINYAVIENATYGFRFASSGSRGMVTHTLIHQNAYGIYANGNANPSISSSRIVNNTAYGIFLQGQNYVNGNSPLPVVTGSTITGNGQFENRNFYAATYYNAANVTLNATSNWWGTADESEIQLKILNVANSPVVNYGSYALTPINPPYWLSNPVDTQYFSPNSDLIKDSISLTGSLNEPSDWVVTINDAAGAVVKTFSGNGTSIDVTWDGLNTSGTLVPDGSYYLRVDADAVGREGIVDFRQIWLDTIAPVASIISPAPSAILQNVVAQDILGVVSDNLTFENYTIAYGVGASPANWTEIKNSNLQPASEDLATWVIGTTVGNAANVLPNGDYTLQLTVTDKAGNSSGQTILLTIDNVSVTNVTQNQLDLDVANGGSVDIGFAVNLPGTATITFYDESVGPTGTPIGSVEHICATAGLCTFVWDGTLNGSPMPEGIYSYTIEMSDGTRQGIFSSYSTSTFVGQPTEFTGTANPFQNEWFTIEFTLPANYYGRLRLDIDIQGVITDVTGGGVAIGPGVNKVHWDGINPSTGLPHLGTFKYKAFYRPLAANSVIVTNVPPTQPVIGGQGTSLEVKADPYVVTLSYGQLSTLRYHLTTINNAPADVSIKLLPPGISDFDDPAAVTIYTGTQTTGDYALEWDGVDTADLEEVTRTIQAEGSYLFAIKAGNTLYKGIIGVYQ